MFYIHLQLITTSQTKFWQSQPNCFRNPYMSVLFSVTKTLLIKVAKLKTEAQTKIREKMQY